LTHKAPKKDKAIGKPHSMKTLLELRDDIMNGAQVRSTPDSNGVTEYLFKLPGNDAVINARNYAPGRCTISEGVLMIAEGEKGYQPDNYNNLLTNQAGPWLLPVWEVCTIPSELMTCFLDEMANPGQLMTAYMDKEAYSDVGYSIGYELFELAYQTALIACARFVDERPANEVRYDTYSYQFKKVQGVPGALIFTFAVKHIGANAPAFSHKYVDVKVSVSPTASDVTAHDKDIPLREWA
jgi:hypothetical protein